MSNISYIQLFHKNLPFNLYLNIKLSINNNYRYILVLNIHNSENEVFIKVALKYLK